MFAGTTNTHSVETGQVEKPHRSTLVGLEQHGGPSARTRKRRGRGRFGIGPTSQHLDLTSCSYQHRKALWLRHASKACWMQTTKIVTGCTIFGTYVWHAAQYGSMGIGTRHILHILTWKGHFPSKILLFRGLNLWPSYQMFAYLIY